MRILSSCLVGGTAAALVLASGCRDHTLTAPGIAPPGATDPASHAVARCDVDVPGRTITCVAMATSRASSLNVFPLAAPTERARADRIVGGQDVYIKLASTNTAFNSGTGIFSTDVSVQNLARYSMGTTDGLDTLGVKLFFQQSPTVTSGSGTVTLGNADGTDTFTATNQPYFAYAQLLRPFEISNTRQWQFAVSGSVVGFSFVVYVDAPMTDETGTLLDRVWAGTTDAGWFTAANWRGGAAPDSTSTVAIPTDSLLAVGHHDPALATDATIANLRVGAGNTLDLGGHTLRVNGNVDALGSISNGVVNIAGATAVIGGVLPGLQVSGVAHTQRATTASAAVKITGALSVANQPFIIRIP